MVDESAVAKDFVGLPESETDLEESHSSPVFLLTLHSHLLFTRRLSDGTTLELKKETANFGDF